MDFTHSYVTTGLSIAIRRTGERDRWLSFVQALTTPTALKLYLGIVVLASRRAEPPCGCSSGAVIRCSPERPVPGVGAGYLVGRRDDRGRRLRGQGADHVLGRAVALLLDARQPHPDHGVHRLRHGAARRRRARRDPRDRRAPPRHHVGTVQTSASADFLRREDIPHRIYASLPDALGALRTGEVRAVVYGDVILRYYAQRDATQALELVPGIIEPQTYAFPLPDRSPLREPLNQALRRAHREPGWRDIQDRYLRKPTQGR